MTRTGLAVSDTGDLVLPQPTPERDPDSHIISPARLLAMIEGVRGAVAESLERGAFPLVLGGDCPVLLGCLGAIAAAGEIPRVLFVDGHEDAWPPASSTTGEAADMELGWLIGRDTAGLAGELRRAIPVVQPNDAIILGARDEAELAAAGVVSLEGVVRVVRPEAISHDPDAVARDVSIALRRRGPFWLHIDLDVLATDSLRAIDYPQAGGLDWVTLTSLTRRVLMSRSVLGWDVTIYNPDLDPGGGGAERTCGTWRRSRKRAIQRRRPDPSRELALEGDLTGLEDDRGRAVDRAPPGIVGSSIAAAGTTMRSAQ